MAVNAVKKIDWELWISRSLLIPQILMFCAVFAFSQYSLGRLAPYCIKNIAMSEIALLISLFMYFSIVRSRSLDSINVVFLVLISVDSLYLFSDGLFWVIDGQPSLYILNIFDNLVYCICPIVLTLVYWIFLGIWAEDSMPHYKEATMIMYALLGISVLFLCGNLTGGYYYFVPRETGIYERGSLYAGYIVFPSMMLIICIIRVVLMKTSWKEKVILLVYPMIPYVNALHMLMGMQIDASSVGGFCSVVFLYTNMYLRRERNRLLREKELTESHVRLLQMQVNPHFFYNTLNSVASLCDFDPQAAQDMVYHISDYMRDNFTDITKPAVITIDEELERLEHYLEIEKIRFPNISIVFELQTRSFELPGFTLQPLVENAIKHGICKRRKSQGTITIASRETENGWIVEVRDDGVGFESLPTDGNHVGLENVRKRLALLCGGRLSIFSVPGEGTTCQVFLPGE